MVIDKMVANGYQTSLLFRVIVEDWTTVLSVAVTYFLTYHVEGSDPAMTAYGLLDQQKFNILFDITSPVSSNQE